MTHEKIPVAVLGATGMVGQRFVTLLENHPWFKVECVAASPASAGKTYESAVSGRWYMDRSIPEDISAMRVLSVEEDMEAITQRAQIVFCALDMDKERIRGIEDAYASGGVAVVSNNSAHRWTPDVPMIMPFVNPEHITLIESQRKNRGWGKGLIAVKPNCSIQSYVPILKALESYHSEKVSVVTLQAVSGAGKTLATFTEIGDNVVPYIGGEEEKSEKEPKKILGSVGNGTIILAEKPEISATCIRVPVSDGHMVVVGIIFQNRPSRDEIMDGITTFNRQNPIRPLNLPSAPDEFIIFHSEVDRPQTRFDRDAGHGMSVSVGRLREDTIFDWKMVGLSHNTILGAAGGAILTAELLKAKGYL